MNKSDFYKQLLSARENRGLNAQGYPDGVEFHCEEITTEEQWTAYLAEQMEVADFCKISEEAANVAGVPFEVHYTISRNYADIGEQLDQLYHDIDDGKLGDTAKSGSWYLAVKKVKDDNPKNGDYPASPVLPTVETEDLGE